MLETTSADCDECAPMTRCPFRFGASLPPDEIILNHVIAIDLVWLEGCLVPHVLDTHKSFQVAAVIRSKSAEDV